jgi:glyoxalase family protein
MAYVTGSHHITLSVGKAQEDVDFHVKTLGLRLIKRTVLFDGRRPIYHLYYGNANGDPSSVITTFPFAQSGVFGKRGTNQGREVLISVPEGSLNYWQQRLNARGVATTDLEVFGKRRLAFEHPAGIEYELVTTTGDERVGHIGYGMEPEYAIHGLYGVGAHVHTPDRTVEFAQNILHAQDGLVEDGDRIALTIGKQSFGNQLEITINRTEDQATWAYGAGTQHHFAWNADTLANQAELGLELEGNGYSDVSVLKNRKYCKATYVRVPSGQIFEMAVTDDEGGWDCDESPQELGMRFQLPETTDATSFSPP